MKLYSAPISPFAARVRIALHHKRVPCEIIAPPASGLKGPEYLAINPMGKVPVLALDDGTCIPESETILEYLEDVHPQPSLMPADAVRRARMRTAIRVTDNYLTPPTTRLFSHLDPATRDASVVAQELAHVATALGFLAHYVGDRPYVVDDRLTLADCCVFPSLFLAQIVAGQLGVTDVLADQPGLRGYVDKARSNASIRAVHDEMTEALAAYQAK
jgi:glutathione S-transferase